MRDLVDGILDAWRGQLPEIAGIELELSKRAARLHTLLSEAAGGQLARFGLTKAEYDVLAVLRSSGQPHRLRPTDLTARLLLSSGGTSNVLRRLVAEGLVTREADPDDARSSWVQLTPTGVDTADAAVLASTEAQRRLLATVPADTARAAADVLREVLVALGDRPV
ncbi:MarR family winged helix-turn-helix transcriptional regulator [Kutzneria sp. 744]|uniref:MarR family winged helix-turn-helix transcriptional regulator n=1 Tax=Kutzneria sp. (strain 744) TaxID=345341 RepID=UPI0004AE0A1E|nr:MarR family transcriptional regulator [Kutzneria sp. 744]